MQHRRFRRFDKFPPRVASSEMSFATEAYIFASPITGKSLDIACCVDSGLSRYSVSIVIPRAFGTLDLRRPDNAPIAEFVAQRERIS